MNINKFFDDILGAAVKSPRWSWGAVDLKNNRVFLRIWKQQISRNGNKVGVAWHCDPKRRNAHGYKERLQHLALIQNGAEGYAVIAEPVSWNADPRKIAAFDEHILLRLGKITKTPAETFATIAGRVPTLDIQRDRKLTSGPKTILQLLVEGVRADRFVPGDPRTFIGYKEAHQKLRWKKRGHSWGTSLRAYGLGELALWLRQKSLPAITGLIVEQTKFEPAKGYYDVNNRPPNDRLWWEDQIRKSIAYEWSAYVKDDAVPTLDELIAYANAVSEGKINTVPVKTRQRCEMLRRRAKQYYRGADGKLACCICGWKKPNDRISGDIVELHHLRHLANLPKQGVKLTITEAIASLSPLCPCCHRIAHCRIDNRFFNVSELKEIIPQYRASTPSATGPTRAPGSPTGDNEPPPG